MQLCDLVVGKLATGLEIVAELSGSSRAQVVVIATATIHIERKLALASCDSWQCVEGSYVISCVWPTSRTEGSQVCKPARRSTSQPFVLRRRSQPAKHKV